MRRGEGLGLAAVLAFVCLAFVPFMGKAYHVDEPLFLAPARHILAEPRRPLDFDFNWYGRRVPMSEINNTPPLTLYALAAGLKATGGAELPMRLFFLPFDLLAAAALYGLARRFLSRPLLPALIVIASPAYLVGMNLLYPEKLAAAFGFSGLYALVRGLDERRPAWFWGSAALLGAALLAKYAAALFLLPAAGFCLERGVGARRLAGHLAACLGGLGVYLLWDLCGRGASLAAAWTVTAGASGMPWSGAAHKLRSLLAFMGGCGPAVAVWPLLALRPRVRVLSLLCAAVLVVFLPWLDLAPLVRPVDRLTGVIFSAGPLCALWWLCRGAPRPQGWALWAPWTLAVLLLLGCVYWSIMARLVVFVLPPLVFAMAESLEARLAPGRLGRLYGTTLAGVLALSLALALVDYRHAGAQKALAAQVSEKYLARGRSVWCVSHWGLQYYLEQAGARVMDFARGGWSLVRPGDVAVSARVNSNYQPPKSPLFADVSRLTVYEPIPLRLISGWSGEGGFYSNVTGFLPYSLSREPLEEFTIVEAL